MVLSVQCTCIFKAITLQNEQVVVGTNSSLLYMILYYISLTRAANYILYLHMISLYRQLAISVLCITFEVPL
jgi:hypothetical protein